MQVSHNQYNEEIYPSYLTSLLSRKWNSVLYRNKKKYVLQVWICYQEGINSSPWKKIQFIGTKKKTVSSPLKRITFDNSISSQNPIIKMKKKWNIYIYIQAFRSLFVRKNPIFINFYMKNIRNSLTFCISFVFPKILSLWDIFLCSKKMSQIVWRRIIFGRPHRRYTMSLTQILVPNRDVARSFAMRSKSSSNLTNYATYLFP